MCTLWNSYINMMKNDKPQTFKVYSGNGYIKIMMHVHILHVLWIVITNTNVLKQYKIKI